MAKKLIQGFTLIEVLTATSISIVLLAAIYSISQITGRSQTTILDNYLNSDGANSAVNILSEELRNSRASQSGSHWLSVALDNDIVFYTDVDSDGVIEKTRYFLDDTTLIKQTTEPQGFPPSYPTTPTQERIIAQNVRNLGRPLFTYYNAQWPLDTQNNPLSQGSRLGQTRSIEIFVRINQNEFLPDNDYLAQSIIQIRMTKDNL